MHQKDKTELTTLNAALIAALGTPQEAEARAAKDARVGEISTRYARDGADAAEVNAFWQFMVDLTNAEQAAFGPPPDVSPTGDVITIV